jgi:hypothetical protein
MHSTFKNKMETVRKRLEFALKEALSTAIAKWLKTGEVNVSNYPIKYANAILSQERIGWQHFLAGKISQEWLKLQADSTNKTVGKKRTVMCDYGTTRNHKKNKAKYRCKNIKRFER